MRPTPGTAPGPQLSGEVSYFFVSPSVGPPTLTNQRVSSSVFQRSPIIIVVGLNMLDFFSRAKVTRWGGMISTPNSDLIAAIRRTLVDTGCPDVSGLGGSNSNPRTGASATSNRYLPVSPEGL